ncbi:hypothetical protein K469DRAFT_682817 [Zopfia rhizophila CBS 207.26]|uniref:RING-type domain-containing protein n=1 Tax=Zopfia rhizophila CBS 207.26 TaxID=1314779 RepID=A0A6A6D915_9PEZI|nr:hypothetical protein K469DRAFT_682817 [Zopfia rhizophila CBS 207.26]
METLATSSTNEIQALRTTSDPVASAFPAIESLNINPAAATHLNGGAKSTRICTFFMQGSCNKGDTCWYVPPPAIVPPQRVHPDATSLDPYLGQQDASSPQPPSDSRARVLCKFLSRPGGCQNGSCPYLNAVNGHEVGRGGSRDFEALRQEALLKAVLDILRGLGFNLNVDCVRIPGYTASSETKATVKVEDPLFAKELSARLKKQRSALSAVPIPIDTRRTNCRKVYISWHKATRSVWLNFGNGEIANRVAQKFNEGRYKCLGQPVKSSTGRRSPSRGGGGGFSYNPVAWTITLSDVPSDATSKDVEGAIILPHDKPRHVEMGSISYRASDAEVSVEVRSRLEEHGPLESFYLAPTSKGKRVKATAWSQDEADARSACSLNKGQLDILRKGKLTVTLVQSAEIKVSTTVYFASKSRIDKESKTWKEQHLAFHVYPDTLQRFTTLKVEGDNTKDVANARKTLHEILSGVVLTDGENAVWGSALSSNGSAYKKLKSIETELHVVIIRDKPKRQLQFYGPPEKFQHAVRQITDMLKEESSTSHEIDLKTPSILLDNPSWFKEHRTSIGEERRRFQSIMDGKRAIEVRPLSDGPSRREGYCPICFCEPDTPTQTSCKHTYCLECFEDCCKSAASTSKDEFQIKCQGDEGTCSTVFTLREVKDHLSSSVFEIVLQSSFEGYIQRHPEAFHYCPTPDCGYVYRCTTASGSKSPAYTCPNCFEPICTSCHARHGDYTCAEYKDIASGGFEALERLKRELNIKDCPKCTTPMEKTEGCNHMTCGGCRTHICWVCMAVFETSGPCYDHMNKEHGGIGLGLQHFMDWRLGPVEVLGWMYGPLGLFVPLIPTVLDAPTPTSGSALPLVPSLPYYPDCSPSQAIRVMTKMV